MFIPGILIAFLTFPGVMVHELAHQFFCRVLRVPIFQVCYFRLGGNPAGYVRHEAPSSPWVQLLIATGPLFVNSLLGMLVAYPSMLRASTFNHGDVLDDFLIWLGFSIAMHSFPSTGDAQSILKTVTSGRNIFARLVSLPVVCLIFLGAVGSIFWLDAVYGYMVIALLPEGLIHLILAG
jgi:hypothetical protein